MVIEGVTDILGVPERVGVTDGVTLLEGVTEGVTVLELVVV